MKSGFNNKFRPVLYYDVLSSHSRSCQMLIKLLQICVDLKVTESMEDVNFGDTYTWINTFCKLPTLVDGNITLCNGHSILIYLCTKYTPANTPSLCPCDYIMRLKITKMLFFEGCILHRCLYNLLTDIFLAKYPNFDVEYHRNKVSRVYNSLNIFLSCQAFLIEDRLTVVDILIVSTVSALNMLFPIPCDKYPKLYKWFCCIEQMEFYVCNEEGLQKLKCLLECAGNFPSPTPLSINSSKELGNRSSERNLKKDQKKSLCENNGYDKYCRDDYFTNVCTGNSFEEECEESSKKTTSMTELVESLNGSKESIKMSEGRSQSYTSVEQENRSCERLLGFCCCSQETTRGRSSSSSCADSVCCNSEQNQVNWCDACKYSDSYSSNCIESKDVDINQEEENYNNSRRGSEMEDNVGRSKGDMPPKKKEKCFTREDVCCLMEILRQMKDQQDKSTCEEEDDICSESYNNCGNAGTCLELCNSTDSTPESNEPTLTRTEIHGLPPKLRKFEGILENTDVSLMYCKRKSENRVSANSTTNEDTNAQYQCIFPSSGTTETNELKESSTKTKEMSSRASGKSASPIQEKIRNSNTLDESLAKQKGRTTNGGSKSVSPIHEKTRNKNSLDESSVKQQARSINEGSKSVSPIYEKTRNKNSLDESSVKQQVRPTTGASKSVSASQEKSRYRNSLDETSAKQQVRSTTGASKSVSPIQEKNRNRNSLDETSAKQQVRSTTRGSKSVSPIQEKSRNRNSLDESSAKQQVRSTTGGSKSVSPIQEKSRNRNSLDETSAKQQVRSTTGGSKSVSPIQEKNRNRNSLDESSAKQQVKSSKASTTKDSSMKENKSPGANCIAATCYDDEPTTLDESSAEERLRPSKASPTTDPPMKEKKGFLVNCIAAKCYDDESNTLDESSAAERLRPSKASPTTDPPMKEKKGFLVNCIAAKCYDDEPNTLDESSAEEQLMPSKASPTTDPSMKEKKSFIVNCIAAKCYDDESNTLDESSVKKQVSLSNTSSVSDSYIQKRKPFRVACAAPKCYDDEGDTSDESAARLSNASEKIKNRNTLENSTANQQVKPKNPSAMTDLTNQKKPSSLIICTNLNCCDDKKNSLDEPSTKGQVRSTKASEETDSPKQEKIRNTNTVDESTAKQQLSPSNAKGTSLPNICAFPSSTATNTKALDDSLDCTNGNTKAIEEIRELLGKIRQFEGILEKNDVARTESKSKLSNNSSDGCLKCKCTCECQISDENTSESSKSEEGNSEKCECGPCNVDPCKTAADEWHSTTSKQNIPNSDENASETSEKIAQVIYLYCTKIACNGKADDSSQKKKSVTSRIPRLIAKKCFKFSK